MNEINQSQHYPAKQSSIPNAVPISIASNEMPNNDIPMATVVNTETPSHRPVIQGVIPGRPLSLSVICRDCRQPFTRLEKNRGGSSYFRCPECQETFLGRSMVSSCLIS